MLSYSVYRPLFIVAGCARPIKTSWVTMPWPSFVQFLQMAITECKNGDDDDDDDNDFDGNDDNEDKNDNATINCWQQSGE